MEIDIARQMVAAAWTKLKTSNQIMDTDLAEAIAQILVDETAPTVYESVPLLDHGYLKVIEFWGSDQRIVEAARMSNDKGFLGWGPKTCEVCGGFGEIRSETEDICDPCKDCKGTGKVSGDEKLLQFLWSHKHATPFEMAGLVIEVQAPIMVFREWHRHRTQSYNEMSARYGPLPNNNYMPTPERCLMINKANKQANALKGSDELTHEAAIYWLMQLEEAYVKCEMVYQAGLKAGIPKELARLCVPVGRYSKMRASANLRNWLAFMTLRSAPDAQLEIQKYSNEVGNCVAKIFPRTWDLFYKPV